MGIESDENVKSRRKTNVTISVDSPLITEIKKEAESLNTSLNSRLNTILTEYVMFYRYVKTAKCIIAPPSMHVKFLEQLDEDEFAKTHIRQGFDAVRSLFLHHNIAMTKENYIKYAIEMIAKNTGEFDLCSTFEDSEGYTTVVMEHNYGEKWSRILSKIHSNSIEKSLHLATRVSIDPKTVTITILD